MSNERRSPAARVAEPFRIFFPVGMLWGMAGVALWPLFETGALPFYPGIAHTRLMIEGFVGLFVFGFLMTAGPRLLGVSPFRKAFVGAVLGATCLACLAHLANRPAAGDGLFALASGLILVGAATRFRQRTDMPPPGLPLAALGLLCAVTGSAALACVQMGWGNAALYGFGRIALFQGFTLLPIVGVGAFFFPKMLGGFSRHDFPEMRKPDAAWRKRFWLSVATAVAFAVSVALEIRGWVAGAYALRVAALGAYVLSEISLKGFRFKDNPLGTQLVLAGIATATGLVGASLFPGYRVAWLHAYFVVGVTGVIFLVSLRVVFGHGGRPDLIRASGTIFAWMAAALWLAAATRVFADWSAQTRILHYVVAAGIWLACGIVWMVYVAPKTRSNSERHPC